MFIIQPLHYGGHYKMAAIYAKEIRQQLNCGLVGNAAQGRAQEVFWGTQATPGARIKACGGVHGQSPGRGDRGQRPRKLLGFHSLKGVQRPLLELMCVYGDIL